VTPANNGLDPAELPKIAEYVGLDATAFNACLISGKFDAKIQADIDNAQATGGNGTPWSIIISQNGQKTALNGAYPYASVKQMVDALLAK
jgi:predicted DsbA family dithiol-disulfide isomerase